MNKKLYILISSLVTCAGTAASAVVAYFQPHLYGAIITAIGIGTAAINDILLLFVEPEPETK